MTLQLRTALLLTLALGAGACGSTRGSHQAQLLQQQLDEIAGMDAAWAYGDIVIGGSPQVDALQCGRRRGYATVINLCGSEDLLYEPAELPSLDLRYVHAPIEGYALSAAQVDRVMDELVDRKAGVIMHCTTGGRAAMMLAIYRAAFEHVPLEIALEDAKQAGMKPGPEPAEAVRAHATRLLARDAGPLPE